MEFARSHFLLHYQHIVHWLEVGVAGARQATTWRNEKSAVPSNRQVKEHQEVVGSYSLDF